MVRKLFLLTYGEIHSVNKKHTEEGKEDIISQSLMFKKKCSTLNVAVFADPGNFCKEAAEIFKMITGYPYTLLPELDVNDSSPHWPHKVILNQMLWWEKGSPQQTEALLFIVPPMFTSHFPYKSEDHLYRTFLKSFPLEHQQSAKELFPKSQDLSSCLYDRRPINGEMWYLCLEKPAPKGKLFLNAERLRVRAQAK